MPLRSMRPLPACCPCKEREPVPTPRPAPCSPPWCAPPATPPLRRAPCWPASPASRSRWLRRLARTLRILRHHDRGSSMSVSLTLDQVKERARRAPLVPLFRDVLSDALTPGTAFAALAGEGAPYLLERVERGGQRGRYSFLAAAPPPLVPPPRGPDRRPRPPAEPYGSPQSAGTGRPARRYQPQRPDV